MPKRKTEAPTEPAPAPTPSSRPRRSCTVVKEPEVPAFDLAWDHHEDYFFFMTSPHVPPSSKVAAFDLDWTIVKPTSGQFAKGRMDWEWMFDGVVKTRLQELRLDGYKIIFFTNQAGIEKNRTQVEDVQWKIVDLCKELGFPIQACICGAEDHWRKPSPKMWDFVVKKHNEGKAIDHEKSFFCGDAAGRPVSWKPGAKRDFSASDRSFAFNIGIPFKTPEECFLGQPIAPELLGWDGIDPLQYLKDHKDEKEFVGSMPIARKKDMVIMVGLPASGKSHFSKVHLVPEGYEWINRDTLASAEKCLVMAKAAIKDGHSVVIDNTNPDPAARKPFIEAAKKAGYTVRAFVWNTPREVCEHLNWARVKETDGGVRRLPDVAFNVCNKKLTVPSESEGISEVCNCRFVPNFAPTSAFGKLFLQRT